MIFRSATVIPVLFATCIVLATLPAIAGDASPRGPASFAEFDRNGNGTISKQEFIATRKARQQQRAAEGRMMRHAADAPSFESMDKNGDGKLTREEYAAGQRLHMQQRRGMPGRTEPPAPLERDKQRGMPVDPYGKGGGQEMPVDPYGKME